MYLTGRSDNFKISLFLYLFSVTIVMPACFKLASSRGSTGCQLKACWHDNSDVAIYTLDLTRSSGLRHLVKNTRLAMTLKRYLFFLFLLILPFHHAASYQLTGVNTTFNFGTIASPFPDLTLTNSGICVGYTVVVEPSTYFVKATSSSSSSTVFQMTNTSNSAFTLSYSVAWAGTSGGSPTFVSLSSGQNSSTTFNAALLGALTCSLLPPNATLQLQLLNANQVLAKQGSYTDTLTILIVAS